MREPAGLAPLHIAVIGHTNVGKTSLLRTLTRDIGFGEVSASPATTRHVERTSLMVGGEKLVELYDTPGLEDSSGLLAYLETIRNRRGVDWAGALDLFLEEEKLEAGFSQEAKALRQLVAADVAFYVIDARDKVRAKHRDELEIMTRAGRPILPVLNFVASPEADMEAWRAALARVNMHALVGFDTVAFDEQGEVALYEKLRLLAEKFAPLIDCLVEDLRQRRARLKQAAAVVIADLLIDIAAARATYPAEDAHQKTVEAETLKERVRGREARAIAELFRLFEFDPKDYAAADLPIAEGRWEDDLFDPESLARFGLSASKAAATGAAAGLAIDLMVGGATLGAAALTGATLGVLVDSVGRHGKKWLEKLSGVASLQVADETLLLVIMREALLVRALLKRGHGSVAPVRLEDQAEAAARYGKAAQALLKRLKPARREPGWSRLKASGLGVLPQAAARRELMEALSAEIGRDLVAAQSAAGFR